MFFSKYNGYFYMYIVIVGQCIGLLNVNARLKVDQDSGGRLRK